MTHSMTVCLVHLSNLVAQPPLVRDGSVDNPPPKFAKNTQGLGVVWVLRNPNTGEFYKKASAYTTKADSDGVEELFRSGMVDSFGDLLEQYRQGKWLLSQEVVYMLEVFCYYGMKDERL